MPLLPSDENRNLIRFYIAEKELRVHCRLRSKLSEHTGYIETVICK
jgi:hypothetical protein